MEYKVPPHDILAEQAILGSMLFDRDAVLEATEVLRPEDFYREDHIKIFEAMFSLALKSEPVDIITVSNELKGMDSLEKVGGVIYLSELIDSIPTSANVLQYIEIVKEKSSLRKIIKAGNQMQVLGFDDSQESTSILAKVQEIVFDLAQEKSEKGYEVLRDILIKTYKEIDEMQNNRTGITGLTTGFIDFDKKTAGLQDSTLVILAARPGMGKSALAVNIATHVAVREKKPVLIFNMEMSKNEIAKRILSAETMIENNKINTGRLKGDERERMVQVLSELSDVDLYIDDTPGIGLMEISSKSKKLKIEKDIGLIVIDYLQLIQPVDKRNQTREQEITTISRGLKKLAMELEIPIIALSQLSRSAERKQGRGEGTSTGRPMLSDLRESGAIEQDADMVLFIYRDEYYNKEANEHIAELIIAKHRGGTTGTVNLYWSGPHTKFSNLAQEEIDDDVFFE